MFHSEGSVRIGAAIIGFVFGAFTGWFVADTGRGGLTETTGKTRQIAEEQCPSYELRRLDALLRDRSKEPRDDVEMLRQRRDQLAEQICPTLEKQP
jgi:hypothetical protein